MNFISSEIFNVCQNVKVPSVVCNFLHGNFRETCVESNKRLYVNETMSGDVVFGYLKVTAIAVCVSFRQKMFNVCQNVKLPSGVYKVGIFQKCCTMSQSPGATRENIPGIYGDLWYEKTFFTSNKTQMNKP